MSCDHDYVVSVMQCGDLVSEDVMSVSDIIILLYGFILVYCILIYLSCISIVLSR